MTDPIKAIEDWLSETISRTQYPAREVRDRLFAIYEDLTPPVEPSEDNEPVLVST